MRLARLSMLLLVGLLLGVVGCAKHVAPDVPVSKPKQSMAKVRMLVVADPPRALRADDDDKGAHFTEQMNQWFEGFTKAFKAAALKAGFRVVEGGEYDVKVELSGQDFDVRHDAVNKTAVVRAKLTTGGKSQELLGEVMYKMDEEDLEAASDHGRWMDKPTSLTWFAHKLFNQVVKQKRLLAMGEARSDDDDSGKGGDAIASGKGKGKGKGKPKGFVTGAPQRNAYALIIGVEKYRDVKTPATGATNDAKSFAELAKSTMGLPAKNIRLAVGDRATKGDIEKHVDWLVANVPKGGRIYLFFSGHGAPDGAEGTPYLLPYDGDPAALDRTALPLQKILDRLQNSPAEDAVAFVDTCFSGAGGRSVLPEGARPLVRVKKPAAKAKVALLSASSGEQISGPSGDKKNGAFTRFVTVGIGRGEADADGDGQITVKELAAWVKPRVEREARKQGREQSPELSSPTGARPEDMVVAHGVQ
jgi:hypothetical protein